MLFGMGAVAAEHSPDPGGLLPTIHILTPSPNWDPARFEIGMKLAEDWGKLGIDAVVDPVDYPAGATRITKLPFDEDAHIGWSFSPRPERIDPSIMLGDRLHSAYMNTSNYMGYSNPEYDELLDLQNAEMDRDQRRLMVFELQQTLYYDLPVIPLYFLNVPLIHSTKWFENWTVSWAVPSLNVWNFINLVPKDSSHTVVKVGKLEGGIGSSNPLNWAGGQSTELMRLVYDTLMRVGNDGVPVPSAAESIEVATPTNLIVHLRPGMKFHDGEPVTAQDVKFSYELIKKYVVPEETPHTRIITNIEVVDDLTLSLTLEHPSPSIFQNAFCIVHILPEHIWADVVAQVEAGKLATPLDWANEHPIGSGPFKWGDRIPDQQILLIHNEDYYFGPPQVDILEIIFANDDAQWTALKLGEIDCTHEELGPLQAEEAKGVDYLVVDVVPGYGTYYLGLQQRWPPFNDRMLRLALAHAIDYDFIVDVVWKGWATADGAFIAPGNEYWHNPNLPVREYDLDLARKILGAAGYTWDSSGRLHYPVEQ